MWRRIPDEIQSDVLKVTIPHYFEDFDPDESHPSPDLSEITSPSYLFPRSAIRPRRPFTPYSTSPVRELTRNLEIMIHRRNVQGTKLSAGYHS